MPQPLEFRSDVFLSHTHADKPRVRRLAERLKAAGVPIEAGPRLWSDEWVIQAGDIISQKVDAWLEQSRVLRLIPASQLSTLNCPHGTADFSQSLESQPTRTAIHRDPANAGRRFIPLLLGDCAFPDTLRRYKVVDFREESEAVFAEVQTTLRDTLLPMLLSGELSVAGAEKEVSA